MAFLFVVLWCLAFAALAFVVQGQLRKQRHYRPFRGHVIKVHTIKGRWQALVRPDDAQLGQRIGNFAINFSDMGDYEEGQSVACLWDGRNPASACEDQRAGARTLIWVSIGAIIFMIVLSIALNELVRLGVVTVTD